MPAEQNLKLTGGVAMESERIVLDATNFVPVAIPNNLLQSKSLKADLQARDIPALIEIEEKEMDADQLGGIPVLVPEGAFELASEIVGSIELDALDDEDEDDFDEDEDEEFDELDEDEDEDLEDEEEEEEDEEDEDEWDEDEFDEEEDEDEEEDKESGEYFDLDDDYDNDDNDDLNDLDDEE